jgi:hypothetical protein
MEPIRYADGLNERKVSFSLFRNALHQHELAASQGWDKTIGKLAEYLNSPVTKAAYGEGLHSIYKSLTINGNKLVKIYNIVGGFDELYSFFESEILESETVYDNCFPLPLERDELVAAPLSINCVNFYKEEVGNEVRRTSFIFCSKQFVTEKEELPIESLTDNTLEDFGKFDEVYGLRRIAVQLFDVVHLDRESNTLQIRMDGLDVQRMKDIEKRLAFLEGQIFGAIDLEFGHGEMLSVPVNFYPCIKKLYAARDGRISELGHTTDSAGVHRGKTRTKHYDFRDDDYHVGGVTSIGNLNPHMLAKYWNSPSNCGVVEILIPGTVAISSSANPTIDRLVILSCASDEDYDFVMNKIFAALAAA